MSGCEKNSSDAGLCPHCAIVKFLTQLKSVGVPEIYLIQMTLAALTDVTDAEVTELIIPREADSETRH